MAISTATPPTDVADSYAKLEEKVLERDQKGASAVYYDLARAGRPLPELLHELVRIHAPYTHVPYHQRIDDGILRFVNNDHCLLSSRASMDLKRLVRPGSPTCPSPRPSGTCRAGSTRGTSSSARCPATTCASTRSSSRASRRCPRSTGPIRSRSASAGRSRRS